MTARALLLGTALALVACSDGQENLVSASEPFRIRSAQFRKGALPGLPPSKEPYVEGGPPQIGLTVLSNIVRQGYGGKKLTGRLSTNAVSAGLALRGVGTGWWLVRAGDLDSSTTPPSFNVSAVADFGENIPTGPTFIDAVAFDEAGRFGARFEQSVCIASNGPEGLSPCPGGGLVPHAAITLSWDTQVDLDLQVLTPAGKVVSPKHPTEFDLEKGETLDPGMARIDRDSNANCTIDGARRETMLWPNAGEAPIGVYGIYVNLFSACGQQAVRYHLRVSTAVPGDTGAGGADGEGEAAPVERVWLDKSGELIAAQTSPAAGTGLFVTEFNFQ